ncbi:MAG: hypothetical protein HYX28_05265 [Candidatus Koribacter versatilis]|uniref:Uncharacterized protein n=1 Tax=Candidatus Korobacter versatilis TaxID=658062 RepID=A0A932A7K4_9BACT|nr:hypothetical protein [Candidatus Koribacter versatilis]
MDRKTINRYLLTSSWFLLLVLALSVGMVWTRTAQANGLLRHNAQQEAQWEPIADGAAPLTDVTEDILGVGLASMALGLLIGLVGPWRRGMQALSTARIYPLG